MRAGQLRHRLAIQTKSVETNDAGQDKLAWRTVATVWGSVEPMKGDELVQAQQVAPRVTHKITVRGGRRLSASQRIGFKGRTFEISAPPIDLSERGISMLIMAIEVPSDVPEPE